MLVMLNILSIMKYIIVNIGLKKDGGNKHYG